MKIDKEASFINFVYPFLFDPTQFAMYVAELDQHEWEGQNRALKVWKQETFPEEELLSHVADFLNPPAEKSPTARLWEIMGETLWSPRGLGAKAEWKLTTPHGSIKFQIENIRLVLFRLGVGFLNVTASPEKETEEDDEWLNFVHYFRFARGQRGVRLDVRRRVGYDRESRQPEFDTYFPEPAGGIDQHPDGEGVLIDLLNALLNTATPQGSSSPWWREVFVPGQLLPYAGLFVDQIPEEEIPKLIYRMRNFFRSNQEIHPALDDLRLDHPLLVPYARQQRFFFSLDGGGFVACNPPTSEFFRSTLPDHLKHQYFLLFILTLQQRFALMMIEDQVATQWLAENPITDAGEIQRVRENAFEQIRDQLLSFTARGYFAQVMQREHHHRCYLKWQEAFQIKRLYQEVSDEVRYMHTYLQNKHEQRLQELEKERRERQKNLERRLSMIAWIIGLPALALTYLNAGAAADYFEATLTLVTGILLGLMIFGLSYYFTNR